MSLRARALAAWRAYSLRRQLMLMIFVIGLPAILLNAVLLGGLVSGYVVDRQGSLMADQAAALGDCCQTGEAVSRLNGSTVLARAMPAALAGTPRRLALIINAAGKVRYASPMPRALEQELLAHARADLADQHLPRWTQADGQLIAEAPVARGEPDRAARPAGMILLTESLKIATGQWHRLLVLVGVVGVLTLTLAMLGVVVAAHAVARPVRQMTATARSIAAGDYTRRATPDGSRETQDLAHAFNTMVDEVLHQRRVERDLLANVSHELAAPLGLIRGYAEALSDGIFADEKQRLAMLGAIGVESNRLTRLSGDLLDLALLETGQAALHLEPVPIGELLAGLHDRFAPLAERSGVNLILDVTQTLPVARTDGLRLEQALINLLTNALRHTPEGGVVTLSARQEADDRMRIVVADTGPGIPPAELTRIWERFYQVDKGRDRRTGEAGVGLGLAIAHTTITRLGGSISASSAPNEGTTFTIQMPLGATASLPGVG
jgi:signal transduction histidine kinase